MSEIDGFDNNNDNYNHKNEKKRFGYIFLFNHIKNVKKKPGYYRAILQKHISK